MDFLLVFILGSIFGSFINMLKYRIPRDLPIVKGRSKCDSCGKTISGWDLMPIISYIRLKGKCRYCGSKIGISNLVAELITASMFVIIYYFFGYQLITLKYLYITVILILISFIDIELQIIPDKIMLFNLIIGILLLPINDITIKSAIIGFFVGGGLLFLLALIGAMGGGDIKLMATMGLLLGYQKIILALLLGFFVGGIISIFLLIFKIKSRKDQIAFGPFLAIGTFLSMTFYSEIIYTYLSLL